MNKNILNTIKEYNQKEIIRNIYVGYILPSSQECIYPHEFSDEILNTCIAESELEAYQKFISNDVLLFGDYIKYFYNKKKEIKKLINELKLLYNKRSVHDILNPILENYLQTYIEDSKYHLDKLIDCEKYRDKIMNTIYLATLEEFKEFQKYSHEGEKDGQTIQIRDAHYYMQAFALVNVTKVFVKNTLF